MADDASKETTYQSLYRKYRPQGPGEVVGQEHVIRALVGAVREDRLAHAFLFCGPRGTGKTSTARILAKMVNCEQGPTAEPCGVCEQCLRIRDGSHLDVVEIDAASHGGVDDARELRERAPTAPVLGREKVYILDEAQRLSREAFDALLKLFEEPPPSVRFVLATTEPHKMPATIVGRCQRFDFRRIATEPLADLLESIAAREGLKLTREAAEQLARQAEGSARDAESMLDQTAVLGGGTITEETVALLVGTGEEDMPFELADAIAVADAAAVFQAVDRLVQQGHDIRHASGQILQHVRDLLVVHAAPEEPRALDASPERHARLASQAAKFSVAELSRILALLVAAQTDMRWTTSPRLTLELALVRSAIPEADPNPSGLASRIERLERLAGIEGAGGAAPPGPSEPSPAAEPTPSEPSASMPEDIVEVPDDEPLQAEPSAPAAPPGAHAPDAGALDVGTIRRSWAQLITHLQQQRQMILAANLDSVTAAAYDGATLELAFPPGRRFAVRKVEERGDQLREAFTAVFGISPRIVCAERGAPAAASEVIEDDDPPPAPEQLLERFRAEFDAEIVDVEGE